jgi:hypothetical protein
MTTRAPRVSSVEFGHKRGQTRVNDMLTVDEPTTTDVSAQVDQQAPARTVREHLLHEAFAMALYVAICLLAAFEALDGDPVVSHHVLRAIWGTTLGLVLAHMFSFRVAGRLTEKGQVSRSTHIATGVQLAGASAVALLVTILVLLVPTATELDAARFELAGIIGAVGYVAYRGATRNRARALLFALGVVIVALAVAVFKHQTSTH